MFPKKIDQDFVKLLLKEVEGLKLEYKQKISSQEKIAKTLSKAFARTRLFGSPAPKSCFA